MTMQYRNNTTGEIITLPCTIEYKGMFIAPRPAWLLAHGWSEYIAPIPEPTLDDVKANKVAEIEAYDQSSSVNEFTLYGTPMWLDKATRVGLVNAVDAAESMGMVNVTLGLGGSSYTIPCTTARQMLYALEMYALECYNVTLGHINAVKAFDSKEEVSSYDYTVGYPSKLEFV